MRSACGGSAGGAIQVGRDFARVGIDQEVAVDLDDRRELLAGLADHLLEVLRVPSDDALFKLQAALAQEVGDLVAPAAAGLGPDGDSHVWTQ